MDRQDLGGLLGSYLGAHPRGKPSKLVLTCRPRTKARRRRAPAKPLRAAIPRTVCTGLSRLELGWRVHCSTWWDVLYGLQLASGMPLLLTHGGRNMGQCGHAGPAGDVEAVVQSREQASLGIGEAGGLLFLPPPFPLLIEKVLDSGIAE